MSHYGPKRFILSIPLDAEPLLEGLLASKVMALPFRARSLAAGDFVAELIRDADENRRWQKAGEKARATLPQAKRGKKPPEPMED